MLNVSVAQLVEHPDSLAFLESMRVGRVAGSRKLGFEKRNK